MFIKKIFGGSALLLISLVSFAAPVLPIQHWQTANGAQVYFVPSPVIPMVQINVVFAAGAGRDGAKPGLAQFTNNMLNQGARNLSADQIAEQFDSVGAQFNATVDRDMAQVSLQSLTDPKYLNPAVDTFTQVLTGPTFPKDGFDRIKNQTLTALASEKQSPKALAGNALYAAVYGEQPYHSPMNGTVESLSTLTVTDLLHFYTHFYVAKNAIITIVGAVTRPQAETLANQITKNLSTGEAAAPLPATKSVLTAAKEQHIKFPSEQTTIVIGQLGINYQNPAYFPLFVGNTILGGSTFSSRLFNEVREKRGLTYGVGSIFRPLQARGPFAIMLQTRNNEANQAVKVARDTLTDYLKEGPTAVELQRTKSQISNNFPLSLAGDDAISNYLVTIGFYHLPLNYLDTYLGKVNAVTADQVKAAMQNALQPDKMVTVLVGNNS